MTVTHSPGLVRAYSGAKLYIGSTTCAFRVSAMQIDEKSSEYEVAARCASRTRLAHILFNTDAPWGYRVSNDHRRRLFLRCNPLSRY